jgi:hypothetical protein
MTSAEAARPPVAAASADCDKRVRLLTPTRRDAAITCRALSSVGIRCTVRASLAGLASQLDADVGALMLTDRALADPALEDLLQPLQRQPSRSSVPTVLLAQDHERGPGAARPGPPAQRDGAGPPGIDALDAQRGADVAARPPLAVPDPRPVGRAGTGPGAAVPCLEHSVRAETLDSINDPQSKHSRGTLAKPTPCCDDQLNLGRQPTSRPRRAVPSKRLCPCAASPGRPRRTSIGSLPRARIATPL